MQTSRYLRNTHLYRITKTKGIGNFTFRIGSNRSRHQRHSDRPQGTLEKDNAFRLHCLPVSRVTNATNGIQLLCCSYLEDEIRNLYIELLTSVSLFRLYPLPSKIALRRSVDRCALYVVTYIPIVLDHSQGSSDQLCSLSLPFLLDSKRAL